MASRLFLEVEDVELVTVVRFKNKKVMDEMLIDDVKRELVALVNEKGKKHILLDFKEIQYLSSAVLGTFYTLRRALNSVQGVVVLCHIDPEIYEVFEVTKMYRDFKIFKDEATAMAFFKELLATK